MTKYVYTVMYAPGEPYGCYTLAICASRERAEIEEIRLFLEESYRADHLYIEETELLE